MSDTLDYEGYYKALGIPPTATADEVKRAFREQARKLHPDRNPNKDTTSEFQRISAAYEVLKDPRKRGDYNAEGARRMQSGAKSGPNSGNDRGPSAASSQQSSPAYGATTDRHPPQPSRAHAELRMCVRCGCLSAQPRVTYFIAVRGLVTSLKIIRKGGVYCHRCAMIDGLKNNLLNWLVGWWALPYGPVKVIEATLNNMVGGDRPSVDNVNLLYRQAIGFYYSGHKKIALGIIEDALRFAPNIAMRDQLLDLRKQMGEQQSGKRLRNEWRLLNSRIFLVQATPLLIITVMMIQSLFSLVNLQFFSVDDVKRSIGRISEMVAVDRMLGLEQAPLAAQIVTAAQLTLYAAPNTNSETLGFLRQGDRVQSIVDAAVGGWAAIKLPNGTIGYVASTGLEPDTDP